MADWKHIPARQSFHVLRGPILIPIVLAIAAVTLRHVLPERRVQVCGLRPDPSPGAAGICRARSHLAAILLPGFVVGLLLGLSTMVVTRWGHRWLRSRSVLSSA
jgi:hypothetical protein